MASQLTQSLNTGSAVLDAFISTVIGGITQLVTELISQALTQSLVQAAIGSAAVATETASAVARGAVAGSLAATQGVQIATSLAASLGPAGFFALPGLLAATQAQILGSLALAKTAGSFAEGGYTSAEGKRDSTGFKVAGIVHEGEYVVPKKVLRTKAGAHIVNQLDNLRKYNKTSTTEGFASGGFTSGYNMSGAIYNTLNTNTLSNLANNTSANSLTDGIIGEVFLRGTTQVIQLKRSEKKMNRYYNS